MVAERLNAVVAAGADGDAEWSEWRWARLYVEPVEQGGAGIDAAVRDMSGDPGG